MASADIYAFPDLYDLVHPGHEAGEVAFYARQAEQAGPQVLELACGTGRLTWPLAERGLRLTGLDCSAAMLRQAQQARRAVPVAPRWVQGDMRAVPFRGAFDWAFIGINSLGHVHRRADLEACLNGVRAALRPGGRLVVSLEHPTPSMLSRDPRLGRAVGVYADARGEPVHLTEFSRYDAASQVSQRRWRFEWPDGTVRECRLSVRLFFPQELLALLHYTGWHVAGHFGKYNEQAFHSDSTLQIVVATPNHSG